jgi:hypothetical protein
LPESRNAHPDLSQRAFEGVLKGRCLLVSHNYSDGVISLNLP